MGNVCGELSEMGSNLHVDITLIFVLIYIHVEYVCNFVLHVTDHYKVEPFLMQSAVNVHCWANREREGGGGERGGGKKKRKTMDCSWDWSNNYLAYHASAVVV